MVCKLINILFKSDLKDIMTGMRAFSYEFVKSFPITSKNFEIETEMTIFALNHNFLIKEIPIEYKDRIDGSESKLNTYSDGFKVVKLIFSFFRDTKPLLFFSIITLILLLISLIYFIPIFIIFLKTGYVEKIPTLLISATVVLAAIIIFLSGVILHVIKRNHNQDFEHFLNNLKIDKDRD